MVFRTAGKLTMAVMISADVFAAQDARRWFSRDVRVGTGSILRLT